MLELKPLRGYSDVFEMFITNDAYPYPVFLGYEVPNGYVVYEDLFECGCCGIITLNHFDRGIHRYKDYEYKDEYKVLAEAFEAGRTDNPESFGQES